MVRLLEGFGSDHAMRYWLHSTAKRENILTMSIITTPQ